eukprot:CAMPEP_0167758510 /NCGR_PEP_ID=MMETSP0110_2-20121227/10509_1 /TAXON_ID=629695 /ORGANISM="Gymnochlora sp., Strain CCMP2014" /LENGTH=180 /DNA_ID=CAMNT_0007644795 /DNA_START=38 /DNA_END=580 /DNA_ORIENTATION=-
MADSKGSKPSIIDAIDEKAAKLPYIPMIADKAKTKPAYILIGGGVTLFLLLVLIFGFNTLVEIGVFSYPAYMAMQALTKGSPTGEWLMYFIILGLFQVIESFYDSSEEEERLTYSATYMLFKVVILVSLLLPQTKGALKIHDFAKGYLTGKSSAPAEAPETEPEPEPVDETPAEEPEDEM